jgi:hypothetical protein
MQPPDDDHTGSLTERFALPPSTVPVSAKVATKRKPARRRPRYRSYLKGPVPWGWLQSASRLGGKALAVGVAIWRLSGIKKAPTVKLSLSTLDMGFDRSNASRALVALERAGLVTVVRAPGCSPLITIIDVEDGDLADLAEDA